MRFGFIFFIALCALQSSLATYKRSMQIDDELISNPCKPEDDADIARTDNLVTHMFEAYKREAESESPPAEHSTTLADVNAHELLARLFLFIDKFLKREISVTPQEGLYDLFDTETDEQRWAADRKWPYRCFDAAVVNALDTLLSQVMSGIVSKATQGEQELALLEFSVVLKFPQFASYVQNIEKRSLHTLCPLILASDDTKKLLFDYESFMLELLQLAETACSAPYESQFFCRFPEFRYDVRYMHKDLVRAGDSAEMQKFAFFWFLAPGLANICGESFQAVLSTDVLTPFAQLAVARLNELTEVSTTTGANLRKIRTFIYDYIFTYFRRYAVDGSVYHALTPFTRQEAPGSKYNTNFGPNYLIHPAPVKDLIQCFRYFVANLRDMEEAIIDGAGIAEIQTLARTALFWFLHPDFHLDSNQYANSFLGGIEYNIGSTNSLLRLGNAVKQYKNIVCSTSSLTRPAYYCNMYQLLHDIEVYTTTFERRPMTKILDPSSNYKKVLELSTMRSIQSDIAALQVNQEQLEQSISSMRSALGDHFHQLATFDQEKAEADVGYLQDKINDFTKRITDTEIVHKLYVLLYHAIASNVAEVGQLIGQLASAIADNCNPVGWVTGGNNIQDVVDQANALAIAGVDTTKLITLHRNIFPRITEKGNQISNALSSNAEIHTKLNTTFHQLKDKQSVDIDDVQINFLADYRGYDPGWSTGDIAAYTILLKEVIDELCNILYNGQTVASAVVQVFGATEMTCLTTKVDAEVLEAVYLEMYDFQYEFMEAMAQAIRALITKHSANIVRNIPEQADDPETYRIRLKSYAHRIKLQSKQHVLLALKEVCDVDEYKNGGIPTDRCEDALQSMAFADIDRVVGDEITECPADQKSTVSVRFPAVLNPNRTILEAGILDLTKLYAGKLTPFQIPYTPPIHWTRRFASSLIPIEPEIGLYVKKMEIFIPDLTNNIFHEVRVTIKQDGLMNVAPGGNVKYGFTKPKKFNLIYSENPDTCANGFDDSPYPKLCDPPPSDVCISSHGVVSENEISPPLYNKWLIKLTIPENLPMPKPPSDGSFYLRGVMTVCYKNPQNIDLSETVLPDISGAETSEDRCCENGQFWYYDPIIPSIQQCLDCPDSYTTRLGGLYCHEEETGGASKYHKKYFSHYRNHHHKDHLNHTHYDEHDQHRKPRHRRRKKMRNFFKFGDKKHSILNKDAEKKLHD